MAKQYNENSIKVHKGLEGVRARPAMYVGDTGNSGYHHLVWEVLDNSVDEAVAGHCNKIDVYFYDNGSVKIADNGRGIPVKKHPTENISTIDVVMTMLHAGGKFGGDGYKTSGGLHGVGASCVNALSEWFVVEVKRDGAVWRREYREGKPEGKDVKKVGECKKKDTGTSVWFSPDHTIFKCKGFDEQIIQRRLRELSFLNPGVEFVFHWMDSNPVSFLSKDGLSGYVNYLLGTEKAIHKISGFKGTVEDCELTLSFVYEESIESKVHTFANNISTVEGGVHHNAALDALAKVVTEKAESELKKHNVSILKSDVLEGLVMVVSIRVPEPEFGGQTKTKLNNENLRKPLGEYMQGAFENIFKKYKEIRDVVVQKVVDAAVSRYAAKKAKSVQRKKSLLDMNFLASKLKDCTSNDPELCEIFLVEGDSAGGGMIEARDRQFQAVLPMRGKVLNVETQSLGRALENKEISSIISALGITVTQREVDLDELRYHKVIICADADPDGGHIICLLMTLFHKFMRKLIDQGNLYVCEMPLFRIVHKGKCHYIKDDAVLKEFKKEHKGDKIEVSRFKGLGEMSVDELQETAMNPQTRILRKVCIEDEVQTSETVKTLMGKDTAMRKEFLNRSLHFEEYEDGLPVKGEDE